MKIRLSRILFPVLFMVSILQIQAQSYSGDLILSTQAEVDNFSSGGYTTVTGNVEIMNSVITDISGLSGLGSIGGHLKISNNDSLTSLSGLEDLDYVYGPLWISQNDLLNSLSALTNLTKVGNGVVVSENVSLPSLIGLENVDSIGGTLTISNNDLLTSLVGLGSLTYISGNLEIGYNDSLVSLSGLDNLIYIEALQMRDNLSLVSITELINLTSISGHVYIGGHPSLTSLYGLNNVSSIGGYLVVTKDSSLTSMSGLEKLDYVTFNIGISDNKNLSSLDGLENLDTVTGSITCNLNVVLDDYCALQNLILNNGLSNFNSIDNLYNPTLQDLMNGICLDCTNILNLNMDNNGFELEAEMDSADYQWISCDNYSFIPGANQQNYTVTENGSYAVIVSYENCVDTSTCIEIQNIGLDENSFDSFRIETNPFHNRIQIDFVNLNEIQIVKVFSEDGKLLDQTTEISESIIFNTDRYASGLYNLVIMGKQEVHTVKMIKR